MYSNFNNNNNNEVGRDAFSENKKPWYLTPCVTVEKDYNPYRAEQSVFEETFKEHPRAFRGATRLENENDAMFYYRRSDEWAFARRQAKNRLGKSSRYIAVLLVLYLVLTNFFALCFQSVADGDILDVLIAVAQYLIVAPALIILANIGHKHKTPTFFKKPQASKLYILKWCLISLGATYAVALAGDILFEYLKLFGVNVNDLTQPIPDTPLGLLVYFLTVVIGAPIFEEILFRGIILTHQIKYGCWHAIFVSAILFGLIHQNHQQMFFAAALGIIFGYIDVKTGSIIPSLIAHTAVNLYSFIMTFLLYFTNYNLTLEDASLMLDGPAVVIMISGILNMLVYALMLFSVIMIIYEIKKNKAELQLPKGDSFLTEKEKFWGFWRHPVMIVLLILLALSIYFISFFNISVFTEPTLSIFK